jgi:hypothetical protein
MMVIQKGNRLKVFSIAVGVVIILFFALSGPVLFRFTTGPMSADYGFTIFNPFRNRDPEQCAKALMELLTTGHCEDAVAMFYDPQKAHGICEGESKNPIASWRLRNREDESEKSTLTFSYRCKESQGDDRLYVEVEKRGDQWQVTDYIRAY